MGWLQTQAPLCDIVAFLDSDDTMYCIQNLGLQSWAQVLSVIPASSEHPTAQYTTLSCNIPMVIAHIFMAITHMSYNYEESLWYSISIGIGEFRLLSLRYGNAFNDCYFTSTLRWLHFEATWFRPHWRIHALCCSVITLTRFYVFK